MRTAIYVRVSSEKQVEGYSIDEQLDRLRNYCKSRDWTIHREYVDGGFSGSNINRPAMNQLIEDAKKKMFDMVLVYKLDRLSRSQKDTLYLIEEVFNKNNIAFNSVTESFSTDTNFGIATLGIMSAFAQLERSTITQRMAMGRVGRAKEGLFCHDGMLPLGYDYKDGVLYINEFEAIQVRKIFDMFESGCTVNAIKFTMREQFASDRIKYSHHSTIRHILTNQVYAGRIPYAGEVYEGQHEAIIEPERFDRIQAMYTARTEKNYSPTAFRSQALLSGFTYCSKCGAKIYQVNRNGVTRHGKPRKTKFTYVCYNRSSKKVGEDGRCTAKIHSTSEIDELVIDEIRKLKYDPDFFDEVRTDNKPQIDENEIIEKEIRKVEAQISKLLDLYSLGTIPVEALSSQIQGLNEKKDKLSNSIKKPLTIEKSLEKQEVMTIAQGVDEIFENGTLIEKRDFIQSLIKRIEVDDDEVHIFWNF